ncbi:MAG: Uma2 family endonuclease [Cyanobacteriota bacterium]|nr:Uma2 family endonuclease [Cyanobacteriota bacterium]
METLAKWTISDYHQMIRSGILENRQVELLAGEVHLKVREDPPHTFYGGSLADEFRHCLGDRALVREARPVTFADSEPEPDIAIVWGSWENYRHQHPQAEDIFLLVEISASSLTKDLGMKKAIYAAAGVRDYWVLNLAARKLIIFRHPADGDYREKQELSQGAIAPLAFPDVKISLDRLFQQSV